MNLPRGIAEASHVQGGYVSIGNFDGVHLGHQHIARDLVARAGADRVPSVVLTFDPHPLQLLRPEHVPPSLTTLEQKSALLRAAGVTSVLAYPTDRALLEMTAEQFFDAIIVEQLRAKGIVEGPNFCFGKNRQGDVGTLVDLCEKRGVAVEIVQPVGGAESMVSSSGIRKLILDGQLAEAIAKLGHPYRLAGRVVEGARRGRTLGFPTANLTNVTTLLPRDGVYAGTVLLEDRAWPAAVNIGPNPTFGESSQKIEVHLIGYSGDLYGRSIAVDLLRRLRDTQRFENLESLQQQLQRDVLDASSEP